MKYIDEWGDELEIEFVRSEYVSGGTALIAVCDGEEYDVATVWLTYLPHGLVYLDTNNCKHLVDWMVANGFVTPTGQTRRSGFCEYPLAAIDKEWLASLEEV